MSLAAGLTLAGVAPAQAAGTLEVTAQTENFATVLVGDTRDGSVSVVNSGSEDVAITDVTLSGSGSSAYTMDASMCVGGTLTAGYDCVVYLTFSPTSVQQFPATVTVTSDAAGSPQPVSVTGAGVNPLANDEAADATTISSLPFSATVNMFLATSSASDPLCAYVDARSLWYKFTAAADMKVGIEVSGAYAVLGVVTGTPGSFGSPTCITYLAPQTVDLTAGTTYYFMLTGYDASLSMSIEQVVPLTAPVVKVTKATVDRTGLLTVYGTVTCSAAATGRASVSISQTSRRGPAEGWAETDSAACGTEPTPWMAQSTSYTEVPFRPGRLSVSGSYEAYNSWYGYVYSPPFELTVPARGTK